MKDTAENSGHRLVRVDRNEANAVYTDAFENVDVKQILTETDGRPDGEKLKEALGDVEGKDIFICGPVEFMKTLSTVLPKEGCEARSVQFDAFGPGMDINKEFFLMTSEK